MATIVQKYGGVAQAVTDNLRKGAARNTIQIAELFVAGVAEWQTRPA